LKPAIDPPALWAGEFSTLAAEAQLKVSALATTSQTLKAFRKQMAF